MSDRLEQLRQMLAEDPNDPFLAYGIALEIAKTDVASGIAKLQEIGENHPTYLPVYYRLGSLLGEINEDSQAIAYLQKGIALAKVQNEVLAGRELQALLDEIEF